MIPYGKYGFTLNWYLQSKYPMLKYIIYTNSIVSVSSGVLCAGISFALGISNWMFYGLFALFSTLVVYNGQRLVKAQQSGKTPWLEWVRQHTKALLVYVLVCAVFAGLCFLKIVKWEYDAMLLLIGASAVSVLYVIRIGGKTAREIPYIKIHLIAFTWTFVLVLFPIMNENIQTSHWWLVFAHYFYVVAVTIPFDIRDLKFDSPRQKTIPQVLGVFFAKINGIILLMVFYAIMLWQQPALITNWIFHLATLVQIILIAFMNEKRADLYCAGFIDGAILILGLSYFFTPFI